MTLTAEARLALQRLEELMRWPGPSPIVGQEPGLCVASGATVTGLADRGLIPPDLLAALEDLVARFDEGWTVADDPALLDVWQSLFVLLADNPT